MIWIQREQEQVFWIQRESRNKICEIFLRHSKFIRIFDIHYEKEFFFYKSFGKSLGKAVANSWKLRSEKYKY